MICLDGQEDYYVIVIFSDYAYEIKVESLNFDKDKDLFYSFRGKITDDIRRGNVANFVGNNEIME